MADTRGSTREASGISDRTNSCSGPHLEVGHTSLRNLPMLIHSCSDHVRDGTKGAGLQRLLVVVYRRAMVVARLNTSIGEVTGLCRYGDNH
jgi:hypothetical protein